MSKEVAHIGVFGLGVMGENLALNVERNGFSVSVFDREPERVDALTKRAVGKKLTGAKSPESFAASLQAPRKIILLVKAGAPVDWSLQEIQPFLEAGDVIVDGGNSHFLDTARREQELRRLGINFIGSGISGGEQGALHGPSLMPGGARAAYELIRPIWEAIAAKVDGEPCVTYVGAGGAGHFVKMVHNAIEYGDMQLIAEAYDLLRKLLGLNSDELGDVFAEWNRGELESYLIEITSKILRVKDPETNLPLVELVLDKAEQKGTGRWASAAALELGVAVPTVNAAVEARVMSSLKDERIKASKELKFAGGTTKRFDQREFVEAVSDALYASKVCSYAQGMNLIRAGSEKWGWGTDLAEVARIWRGGCIIRAKFLDQIKKTYSRRPALQNLLLDEEFGARVVAAQDNWRRTIASAVEAGVPVPAMSASLSYFDTYRSESLPLNLTQAQRDFFGSHTYERIDKPGAAPVHTPWETLSKNQS